jgi:hypothetical protein
MQADDSGCENQFGFICVDPAAEFDEVDDGIEVKVNTDQRPAASDSTVGQGQSTTPSNGSGSDFDVSDTATSCSELGVGGAVCQGVAGVLCEPLNPTTEPGEWTRVRDDLTGDTTCVFVPEGADIAAPPPPPTDAQVAEAFTDLPLAIPDLDMNPPAPACAVLNVPNTFYLDPPPTDPITTDLLGTPITVYPVATSYTFDYGDGTTTTTTDPGAPYPVGRNTHTYTSEARYEATVTVTWGGDWEAPGVPRGPIPGTAQTTSDASVVYAHAYQIVLVEDPEADLPVTLLDAGDPCGT